MEINIFEEVYLLRFCVQFVFKVGACLIWHQFWQEAIQVRLHRHNFCHLFCASTKYIHRYWKYWQYFLIQFRYKNNKERDLKFRHIISHKWYDMIDQDLSIDRYAMQRYRFLQCRPLRSVQQSRGGLGGSKAIKRIAQTLPTKPKNFIQIKKLQYSGWK